MAAVALLSASPRSLEKALAAALPSPRGLPRVFVVAPTRRLLDHLERRLAAERGALAGVRFLHHQALARALLLEQGEAGGAATLELDGGLLAALLRPRLRGVDSPLSRWLERQPEALGALLATFRDLRDSGFTSPSATPSLSRRGRATLELFRRHEELLATLATLGLGDAAELARRATASAREQPPPCDLLLHHGAYELIGVHLELVRALAERTTSEWFVPAPDAASPLPLALVGRVGAKPRFQADSPSAAARASEQSFAGPREEMRFALRQLLAWHQRDGVPFAEMAVLARLPGPYAPALFAESALLGIEPATSFERLVKDQPAARRLAPLLEALSLGDEASAAPAWRRVERAWRGELPAGFARDLAAATSVPARFAALAPAIESLGDEELAEWTSASERAARALPTELLETALPDGPALARWLLARLRESPRARAGAPGGVNVLDFHQARALPWRRAVVVGCNERLLPLRAADDAFLPDADRAALAEASGRPIPRRAATRADDELLFEVVRRGVEEELLFTWSRADERGRSLAASPLLRRLRPAPIARPLVWRHPLRELSQLHAGTGLLRAEEALALAASARPDDAAELARRRGLDVEPLAAGLDMIAAIDEFRPGSLRFDASGIRVRPKERFGATELERLGSCPLQYFFAQELGLAQEDLLDEEDRDSGELSRRRLGNAFHDVLATLYRRILRKDDVPAEDALARARELLLPLLDAAVAEQDREHALLPALAPIRLEQWRRELLAFVEADLARMRALGLRGAAFEEKCDVELDLGGVRLPLRVRLDRLLLDAQGREHLGDYKLATRADLKRRASWRRVARGEGLQLPIYALARAALGKEIGGLELLALEADSRDEADAGRAAAFDVDELPERRKGLLAILKLLLELREAGTFPIARDRRLDHGACGRCDFRRACRHSHGATGARIEAAPEHAPWLALGREEDDA
jgi:hypothetical protein